MATQVVIVGVGALGSHVVQFLRNLDVSIRVIDFDRVEQKNVLAQFHSKKSVGKSKVQSLAQTMQFLFARKIDVIPHRLEENNAAELLGGAKLIVDCLDNVEARLIVSTYARANGVACLHGALAPDGQFGRVIWDKDFVADAASGDTVATCEDGEHLPFIGVVATYLAYAAQRFVEQDKKMGFQVHPAGATPI